MRVVKLILLFGFVVLTLYSYVGCSERTTNYLTNPIETDTILVDVSSDTVFKFIKITTVCTKVHGRIDCVSDTVTWEK